MPEMTTTSESTRLVRRIGRYLGHNLFGLLAVLIALSGTAYAAATIGSAEIIDNSVRSIDIKTGTVNGSDLADEGVTGTDIRNGSVREVDVAPVPWRSVGPSTGASNCAGATPAVGQFCESFDEAQWTNYGAEYQTARFRRGATGEVALEGLVKKTGPSPEVLFPVFVLPQGYRPQAVLLFPVACGDGVGDAVGAIEIHPNGDVFFRDQLTPCPSTDHVSLSGISFSVG